MNNNIIGIITSLVFIFITISVSAILSKIKLLSNEGSRKFIHIVLSNWWIVAMKYFDNPLYAAVVPALFVIINYISYKKQILKVMEREDKSVNDLGTVYYAISLLILSLITFGYKDYEYIGALGILVMGYGDGLSAVIGTTFGKRKFKVANVSKSVEGTITMFITTFVVVITILNIYLPVAFIQKFLITSIVSIVATIVEAYTPYGLDNLTVPLGTSLLSFILITFI